MTPAAPSPAFNYLKVSNIGLASKSSGSGRRRFLSPGISIRRGAPPDLGRPQTFAADLRQVYPLEYDRVRDGSKWFNNADILGVAPVPFARVRYADDKRILGFVFVNDLPAEPE